MLLVSSQNRDIPISIGKRRTEALFLLNINWKMSAYESATPPTILLGHKEGPVSCLEAIFMYTDPATVDTGRHLHLVPLGHHSFCPEFTCQIIAKVVKVNKPKFPMQRPQVQRQTK